MIKTALIQISVCGCPVHIPMCDRFDLVGVPHIDTFMHQVLEMCPSITQCNNVYMACNSILRVLVGSLFLIRSEWLTCVSYSLLLSTINWFRLHSLAGTFSSCCFNSSGRSFS